MDKITLEYDLHRDVLKSFFEDLYLNQRTEYVRKKSSNLFAKIFILLLIIVVALYVINQDQLFALMIPIILLIIWIFVGVTNQFPKLVWWWAKRSIDRLLYWDIESNGDGIDNIHYHVEFQLDSIDITKRKSESHYRWGDLFQIIYLEDCVVLYLTETNCLCVPKNIGEGYDKLAELIRIKSISYDLRIINKSMD